MCLANKQMRSVNKPAICQFQTPTRLTSYFWFVLQMDRIIGPDPASAKPAGFSQLGKQPSYEANLADLVAIGFDERLARVSPRLTSWVFFYIFQVCRGSAC